MRMSKYLFVKVKINLNGAHTTLIFECLLFGLKTRGLLILLLPDISPASVAGNNPGARSSEDAGETSGRSISRPRVLSPKSKHSNISADRESLNQQLF